MAALLELRDVTARYGPIQALHGVSLQGATAYCTHQPCAGCTKLLISAGVERIVYRDAYPDPVGEMLLREAGVPFEQFGLDPEKAPA